MAEKTTEKGTAEKRKTGENVNKSAKPQYMKK